MKVLISGGHLTPALAIIEYIQKNHPQTEIVFVGREFAREDTKQPSAERSEVTALGVTFIPFTTGKFTSLNPTTALPALLKTTGGFFHALQILLREKPDVFLSFGSYLAVPVAFAAWVSGIPIVTHEQTRTVGSATRIIAALAKTVAVSYKETKTELTTTRNVVVTGNPLRSVLFSPPSTPPSWYNSRTTKPLLYITGGSQGSEVLNSTIMQALPKLTKDWNIIHQTGRATQKRNYAAELEAASASLPARQRSSYFVREWITAEELAWIYKHASAVTGRAGANTVQELATFKVPAVLIPLPFSHHQEQQKNAEWLASTGGAYVLPQKSLTPQDLSQLLAKISATPAAHKRKLALLTDTAHQAPKKLYACIQKATPSK